MINSPDVVAADPRRAQAAAAAAAAATAHIASSYPFYAGHRVHASRGRGSGDNDVVTDMCGFYGAPMGGGRAHVHVRDTGLPAWVRKAGLSGRLIASLLLLLLLMLLLPIRVRFCLQAAHWSVICQAMEGHVRRALSSGWSLPSLKHLSDPDMSMKVTSAPNEVLPRAAFFRVAVRTCLYFFGIPRFLPPALFGVLVVSFAAEIAVAAAAADAIAIRLLSSENINCSCPPLPSPAMNTPPFSPGGKPGAVLVAPRGGRTQLVRLPRALPSDSAQHERQEHADEVCAGVFPAVQRGPVRPVHVCCRSTVRVMRQRGGGREGRGKGVTSVRLETREKRL